MKLFFLFFGVVILIALMSIVFAGGVKQGREESPSALRVATSDDKIEVWHDDERHVTCWIYHAGYKGGLSCIPDQDIRL